MISRRQVRIKVMQALYSYFQNKDKELEVAKKKLITSTNKIHELYIYLFFLLSLLRKRALKKNEQTKLKHIFVEQDLVQHLNFLKNNLISLLFENKELNKLMRSYDLEEEKKLISLLFDELSNLSFYKSYSLIKEPSFSDEKKFLIQLFDRLIASNIKVHHHLEVLHINWADDVSVANFFVLKKIKSLKQETILKEKFTPLFKNKDDKEFSTKLFVKTILNDNDYTSLIVEKVKNWESDRIALIDLILMKMAITEFLFFNQIPVKVSLNEYIDISKEYSTPKSKVFINGILDKLLLDFKKNNRIKKIGRGLV